MIIIRVLMLLLLLFGFLVLFDAMVQESQLDDEELKKLEADRDDI